MLGGVGCPLLWEQPNFTDNCQRGCSRDSIFIISINCVKVSLFIVSLRGYNSCSAWGGFMHIVTTEQLTLADGLFFFCKSVFTIQ